MGTVDPRFGITEEEFGIAADEAVELWNRAVGRTVLARAEDGLPVSLAFDDRQRATQVAGQIDQRQEGTNAERAVLEERQQSIVARQKTLERDIAAFNTRADTYQAEVTRWNSQGGAPPDVHARLEQERKALDELQRSLASRSQALEADSAAVEKDIADLNARIRDINASVDSFNRTVDHEFEQGLYIEDEQGTRIVVYEFSTRQELIWVLAHEFGHALGLGHLDDTSAIMYAKNQGGIPKISEADKQALIARCAE
jgi:vacuolar-type H+-ATPase subunit I/STV1